LQKIVEPWSESDVTWENQPQTTEIDQVRVSPYLSNTNFVNIDVTPLYVAKNDSTGSEMYGMMLTEVAGLMKSTAAGMMISDVAGIIAHN
jgi:hypothetical protein